MVLRQALASHRLPKASKKRTKAPTPQAQCNVFPSIPEKEESMRTAWIYRCDLFRSGNLSFFLCHISVNFGPLLAGDLSPFRRISFFYACDPPVLLFLLFSINLLPICNIPLCAKRICSEFVVRFVVYFPHIQSTKIQRRVDGLLPVLRAVF